MTGHECFVNTTGAGGNAGTIASPFATVAAAPKAARPGDSVCFLAGTYRNRAFGDGNVLKDGQDVAVEITSVHGGGAAPARVNCQDS